MAEKKKSSPSLSEIRERVASRDQAGSGATKDAIRDAARDLMAHDHAVNVKSIAEKAQISRGTFYAHYEGLDSLTVEMMVEDLSNEPFSARMLVAKYADRRAMYRKVLHSSNSRAVLEAMVVATSRALLISSGQVNAERNGRLERLARFTAWGYIGTLDSWLREGEPVSPDAIINFLLDQTPDALFPADGGLAAMT